MRNSKDNRHVPFGLSLPIDFLEAIDRERGDISRSKYVLRLLEKNCQKQVTQKNMDLNEKKIPVDPSFEAQSTGIGR